jgi:D-aspartate ligase
MSRNRLSRFTIVMIDMKLKDVSTPVVVLRGVESASHGALGVLRSLGRLGVPVYAVAPYSRTAAFFSRYCRGKYVCDVANGDEQQSLNRLLGIGRKIGGRAILIPTDDKALLFCANHDQVLGKQFLFPGMCSSLVRELSSKQGMYHLAKKHGVPTPEAAFPKCRQDVLEFISRATFPVMVKGVFASVLWKSTGEKMFIVHSASELLDKYDAGEDTENPNWMLQEYIPGGDDTVWMLDGYFNERSECLIAFTGKKIRQYPIHHGSTSLGICLTNETVRKVTTQFMKRIGYKGILDTGYRYDARDGLFKLLDVNPRIGSTFRLFVGEHGLDVARALYLDLTGQPVVPEAAREGRKWFVEDQDLVSCMRYRQEGTLTLKQWIQSFRGAEEAAYFASDDLYPCVRRAMDLCVQAIKRLRRVIAQLFTAKPNILIRRRAVAGG